MFDLKVINSVLDQMEDERGIPREKMLDAIEQALATAYKKEFGKRGQIIRADFDIATGTTTFNQAKIVVDESMIRPEEELAEGEEGTEEAGEKKEEKKTEKEGVGKNETNAQAVKDGAHDASEEEASEDTRVRFDPEKHIMIENARLIKKDAIVEEELIFPLEAKDDFGRIAAQTAKQVIIQKIREAEKESALAEFGQKAGDVVLGHVQRFERGNLYIDLGRVTGVMPYDEQIPGERFRPGERIRALLVTVDETPRGVFLKLSRSHPLFLEKLFEIEAPELQNGTVEIKTIAREAGSRSKIAVAATDAHIDPVGSLVGQRGVRVSTVMSELGGEKIDIIEWSPEPDEFIEDALSPAQVLEVKIIEEAGEDDEDNRGHATVEVAADQQSLAIGRGGQNVRLAAKLTGWKIDIVAVGSGTDDDAETDDAPTPTDEAVDADAPEAKVEETEGAEATDEAAETTEDTTDDVSEEKAEAAVDDVDSPDASDDEASGETPESDDEADDTEEDKH
ncbi:MAG: transcription termination factor NusA [Candidatus Pacebacteria bacterium]|nr:transcription termination factor NusA [Candidatus Paceibacterota bacterium]